MPTIRTLAAVVVLAAATAPAAAQDWPTHAVTMVVPFAPGGGGDLIGRILAPRLSELLGRTVIVENIGGAGGMNGAARVANAAPDGYQFVLGNIGTHAQNQTLYKNPLYNAATDFAPVALVAEVPTLLVARKDLPADNLPEFIAYAKAHLATMQYGSAGAGSNTHLACTLLNAAIGINITHIPYRGVGPAIQDLIAGRIDYQCAGAGTVLPQIEGGTMKAIAALGRNGTPIVPNLLSAHQQGADRFRRRRLERTVPAEGHAGADRPEAARCRVRHHGHAGGGGADAGIRRRLRRARTPVAGIPAEIRRKRDREMGGPDQGPRHDRGVNSHEFICHAPRKRSIQ